jgi:hypothetical protein
LKKLTIPDLKIQGKSAMNETESARSLSREQMQRVRGGRAVKSDGIGKIMDDFSLAPSHDSSIRDATVSIIGVEDWMGH